MPSLQSQIIISLFRLRRILFPPAGVLDVEKERSETESLAALFKTKVEFTLTSVNLNKIQAEWVVPSGVLSECIILYFHGGSYNSGSIKSHLSLAANIANSARARALIVGYRLAPEHPFPAAVDDAVTAYRWLLTNGHSPDHIVVAGDSAGGGLAISLLVSLREVHEPLPAAAVCLSPWMDLTCAGESWKTNARHDIMLERGSLMESSALYLRGSDPKTPLASPLYADLKDLPPLLIQVASDEFLLSDSTCFAEKARAAGVHVTLEVWEGMQHEWHFGASILPEARQAIARIGEFISTIISGSNMTK